MPSKNQSAHWSRPPHPSLARVNFTPTVDRSLEPLTIKSLEVACVAPRWGFVRLVASNGVEGFGEFSYEGQTAETAGMVKTLEQFIAKRKLDIANPADLTQAVYASKFYNRDGLLWSALAGIEIASWDIRGKMLNLPIHSMLGGAVRDCLKVYHWAGDNFNNGVSHSKAIATIQKLIEKGITAVKLNAVPHMHSLDVSDAARQALARAQAIRKEFGDKIELAFDFHGRVQPAAAKRLAEILKVVRPMFIEEPVPPEHNGYLPSIAEVGIPIATGERMFSPQEFSMLCAQLGSVHILQPDLVHVGGIYRTKKIADMAESFGLAVAPHCPLGPIAFMACLHVMMNSPAGSIQECSGGIHYNKMANGVDPFIDYLIDPSPLKVNKKGCVLLPKGPGLGIELDWKKIKKAAAKGITWDEDSCADRGLDSLALRW